MILLEIIIRILIGVILLLFGGKYDRTLWQASAEAGQFPVDHLVPTCWPLRFLAKNSSISSP